MTDVSVQLVAITKPDGTLALMQFITNDGNGLERQATDEAIAQEIERAGITATAWQRIAQADLPADRSTRSRWRLQDRRIVVAPQQ